MNQLSSSPSSYLRSAAHQPVSWLAWSPEALAYAQQLNKPILLDIGAVWCHWCHVMDGESYEDAEVAAVINELYVAIKVDRDERPDLDSRYQAAVQAISGQGGWPLTAFLTPDGRPYFGTTYIPRHDRFGRPGILHVLRAMANVWQTQPDQALETATEVMQAIAHNEDFTAPGELSTALTSQIADNVLARFDPVHGGFGQQPKFPHPAALDLLLHRACSDDDLASRDAFLLTLAKMASGGVYDQLAGGFHRYSVDAIWRVPHFEKMLYDNTELLRNYVHGFQAYGREAFAATARAILAWFKQTLTDQQNGGFYASQDADVGLDDDGDYFTWTRDEAASVLTAQELRLATLYWGLRGLGDMHHNPAKNVLHKAQPLEAIAADRKSELPTSLAELSRLRDSACSKLLAARSLRTEPFVDRTLYTSWNAMAISATMEAARVLDLPEVRAFAQLSLDRLLSSAWDGQTTLRRVMAYADGTAPAEPTAGTLDDYAFTVHAALEVWLASGELRYFTAATTLAHAMIELFYDNAKGGFFDADPAAHNSAVGVLTARRKPLQDTPTPAANSVAAAALARLATFAGSSATYHAVAQQTLSAFAGSAPQFGLFAASYALALERLLQPYTQVIVVGSGEAGSALEAAALAGFALNKSVLRLTQEQLGAQFLPPALAETLLHAPAPKASKAWVLLCKNQSCLPPILGVEELKRALQS